MWVRWEARGFHLRDLQSRQESGWLRGQGAVAARAAAPRRGAGGPSRALIESLWREDLPTNARNACRVGARHGKLAQVGRPAQTHWWCRAAAMWTRSIRHGRVQRFVQLVEQARRCLRGSAAERIACQGAWAVAGMARRVRAERGPRTEERLEEIRLARSRSGSRSASRGAARELVAELTDLVDRHPLRERLTRTDDGRYTGPADRTTRWHLPAGPAHAHEQLGRGPLAAATRLEKAMLRTNPHWPHPPDPAPGPGTHPSHCSQGTVAPRTSHPRTSRRSRGPRAGAVTSSFGRTASGLAG